MEGAVWEARVFAWCRSMSKVLTGREQRNVRRCPGAGKPVSARPLHTHVPPPPTRPLTSCTPHSRPDTHAHTPPPASTPIHSPTPVPTGGCSLTGGWHGATGGLEAGTQAGVGW